MLSLKPQSVELLVSLLVHVPNANDITQFPLFMQTVAEVLEMLNCCQLETESLLTNNYC